MEVILKKVDCCNHCFEYSCEYSKPRYKNVKLKAFEYWNERTCTIEEFDKKFGKREGVWHSKGTEHHEVECNNKNCSWRWQKGHKHCRRRLDDKKMWSINFKTVDEFEKFVKVNQYLKIYAEDEYGGNIVVEV